MNFSYYNPVDIRFNVSYIDILNSQYIQNAIYNTKVSLAIQNSNIDVSVLENGEPILIEANLYDGQLDFHQIHNGPLFGDDTEKIMEEIFK